MGMVVAVSLFANVDAATPPECEISAVPTAPDLKSIWGTDATAKGTVSFELVNGKLSPLKIQDCSKKNTEKSGSCLTVTVANSHVLGAGLILGKEAREKSKSAYDNYVASVEGWVNQTAECVKAVTKATGAPTTGPASMVHAVASAAGGGALKAADGLARPLDDGKTGGVQSPWLATALQALTILLLAAAFVELRNQRKIRKDLPALPPAASKEPKDQPWTMKLTSVDAQLQSLVAEVKKMGDSLQSAGLTTAPPLTSKDAVADLRAPVLHTVGLDLQLHPPLISRNAAPSGEMEARGRDLKPSPPPSPLLDWMCREFQPWIDAQYTEYEPPSAVPHLPTGCVVLFLDKTLQPATGGNWKFAVVEISGHTETNYGVLHGHFWKDSNPSRDLFEDWTENVSGNTYCLASPVQLKSENGAYVVSKKGRLKPGLT